MTIENILAFNGINRQVSPFLMALGDVSESQNLITEKIGVLQKSFDYSIKGTQIVDNYSIIGALDFQRNDGTHEHVVAVDGASNADIYIYGTDWATQSQSLTKANDVSFAYSPTIDTLFACNYADATRSYNGTSWSTSTNVTDAPKAKYIISWGDRVYLLNCKIDADEYPSRAYRSCAVETEATWDTTNDYIQFEDVITGVGTNGENMFVGCQNSTYIFTLADGKYKVSDIGCVSNDSIVTHGNYTFYAADDGFYAYNGGDTFKVSSQIQSYWDKIPVANWDSIQAVVKGNHIYVFIGDITAPWDSSETLSNVIFDFNVLQNNWNRGQLGTACTNLHAYITSEGRKVFMGDDDGNVFEMFDDSGQQNGADYSSHVETSWIYGSGPNIMDDYSELWGYGEYLSGLGVQYKTEERNDWSDLVGELNEDSDVVKFPKVRAYKIKFRLSEFSGKNLYELERIDVGYEPAFIRNEDKTR